MTTLKQVQAVVMSFAIAVTLATPPEAFSRAGAAVLQDNLQTAPITASSIPTPKELQQLVAPIALYPRNALGTQESLAASTNPTDVVEADRWLQQNRNLKGDQLVAAVDKQPWDPSIKALSQFPEVLNNMSQNLAWTSGLGDAYFNDPNGVMSAIQVLRKDAQDAGNLKNTPQQTVTTENQTIVIAPANPEVVYVPTYSPAVVYGEPIEPYPGYSGWETAAASALSFGAGMFVGAAFNQPWGWGGWGTNWRGGSVVYNRNNYVSHNNTFVNRNTRYNNVSNRANQVNRGNINSGNINRNLDNRSINKGNLPDNRTFNKPDNRMNDALNQANRMNRGRRTFRTIVVSERQMGHQSERAVEHSVAITKAAPLVWTARGVTPASAALDPVLVLDPADSAAVVVVDEAEAVDEEGEEEEAVDAVSLPTQWRMI